MSTFVGLSEILRQSPEAQDYSVPLPDHDAEVEWPSAVDDPDNVLAPLGGVQVPEPEVMTPPARLTEYSVTPVLVRPADVDPRFKRLHEHLSPYARR